MEFDLQLCCRGGSRKYKGGGKHIFHVYFDTCMCAFCTGFSRLEVPEQALGGIPLGLGLVVKINLLNIHEQS